MNKSSKVSPRQALTTNTHLIRWIDKIADLCNPSAIHWVDGSEEERDRLYAGMIANGTLIKLNQKLWPGGVTMPAPMPAMSRGWKAVRSSARSRGIAPGRRTTRKIRGILGKEHSFFNLSGSRHNGLSRLLFVQG